jgi:excisionase family DNA binding protein
VAPEPADEEADFLTVQEVALMFKVTPVTVRNWIKQGKLTYIKINGRMRVHRASVRKLAQYNFGGRA